MTSVRNGKLGKSLLFISICSLSGVLSALIFGSSLWLFDIVFLFWPYVTLSAFCLLLATFLLGERPARLLCSLAFLASLMPFFMQPQAPQGAADRNLRVISANLLMHNDAEPGGFLRFLTEQQPDVLFLQETEDRWQKAIAASGLFGYPSSSNLPARDDMKVFSRLPILSEVRLSSAQAYERYPMRLVLGTENDPLILYALHPDTPRSPARWKGRNAYLDGLADAVLSEKEGAKLILAGDWNTPPWSPYFARFFEKSGLFFARASNVPVMTRFSRRLPFRFGSMIDHIAVSGALRLASWRVGPDFGSNHIPVVADLSFN